MDSIWEYERSRQHDHTQEARSPRRLQNAQQYYSLRRVIANTYTQRCRYCAENFLKNVPQK